MILRNHTRAPIRKERLSPKSKARREASRNEFVEKGGVPNRVASFREINSSEDCPRSLPGLVKPSGIRRKFPRGGPKFRHNCVTSQTTFAFALHFLFLGSEGEHSTVVSPLGTLVAKPIQNGLRKEDHHIRKPLCFFSTATRENTKVIKLHRIVLYSYCLLKSCVIEWCMSLFFYEHIMASA